jgi:hypothetical protein
MSTRVLLLIEFDDIARIRQVVGEGIRTLEWWRFWGRSGFTVGEAEAGWVMVELDRGTRSPGTLSEEISSALSCRTLFLSTESVSGSEEILFCIKGWNVRWLWYANGEDHTFADEGDPLEFEEKIMEQRRAEVEAELAAMDEEERAEHQWMLRETCLYPRGVDFARELGCPLLE